MMSRLLFVSIALFGLIGLTVGQNVIPTNYCAGSKSAFDCRPDYTTACAVSGSYTIVSGSTSITIAGQKCGSSVLTGPYGNSNVSRALSFCCPSGTYRNETYFCSSAQNTGLAGSVFGSPVSQTLSGDYWSCNTQTGKDLINDIVDGLSTIFKVIIAAAVICVVGTAFSIAWCCCLGAWCRNRGYVRSVPVVVSPVYVASPGPVHHSPSGSYQAPHYHNAPTPQGYATQGRPGQYQHFG